MSKPEIERDLLVKAQAKGLSLVDYAQQVLEREAKTESSAAPRVVPPARNLVELFENSPFKGLNMEFERDRITAARSSCDPVFSRYESPLRTTKPAPGVENVRAFGGLNHHLLEISVLRDEPATCLSMIKWMSPGQFDYLNRGDSMKFRRYCTDRRVAIPFFPIFLAVWGSIFACAQSQPAGRVSPEVGRRLTIAKDEGGSVTTNLGYGIAVNKNSTLRRRIFVVNDESSPVQLQALAAHPLYKSEKYSGSYSFQQTGDAKAVADVRAVEIIIALFDLWGERMKNLSILDVSDIPAGTTIPKDGSWYASEGEVHKFYNSVAFVKSVMRSDGSIWRADLRAVAAKLSEVQLTVSESGLDETKPQPEPKK